MTAPRSRLRRRIYALLEPSGGSGAPWRAAASAGRPRPALMLEAALVAVIIVNTLSLILWTEPALSRRYDAWFRAVEYITVAVFVFEYALRLWAAPEANPDSFARPWRQRVRYACSFAALVDAAAIIPSLVAAVSFLALDDAPNLSFLISARLLTRTVKLARYYHGWRRLAAAFRLKSGQLLTAAIGLLLVHTLAASLMYFAESGAQPEVFSSIPAAMWWSVVTLTTVGYGDAVPVTGAGRALAAVIAIVGIGLFALPAGILSAGLREADLTDDAPAPGQVCPHCGHPRPQNRPDD